MPFWNERFTVAPADPLDAHRPLPLDTDLEALFAETNLRTVTHDFTVRFQEPLLAGHGLRRGGGRHRARLPDRRRTASLRRAALPASRPLPDAGGLGSHSADGAQAGARDGNGQAQAQAAEAEKRSPLAQALPRQRGTGHGQAETPRRPLRRDRSRPVQTFVLNPPAGTAAPVPVPAGVGRDRRVGIRAPEACRCCGGRSAHHDRPRWQAQCELRAIRAAVPGPLPSWPPPGQSLATATNSAGPAATGLKAPGAGCSAPSSPGVLGPHARRPTPALRPRKNPLSTPPKRTFLLLANYRTFLLWFDRVLWQVGPSVSRPGHGIPKRRSRPTPTGTEVRAVDSGPVGPGRGTRPFGPGVAVLGRRRLR